MTIASVCTGTGALDMAVQEVFGGDLIWIADNDPAASVLLEHHFPGIPNLGDISQVRWKNIERPDILCGGFSCQNVSCAGDRTGLSGKKSSVWRYFFRAIKVLRPDLVVIENVRGLTSAKADSGLEYCRGCMGNDPDRTVRALGAVLGDLAGIGYDAQWDCVRASDRGAPHKRERVVILAWPSDPDPAGLERAD
jgi:DNA (cytosine-5)-methyltransferase 1